jgi:hypothetical protein
LFATARLSGAGYGVTIPEEPETDTDRPSAERGGQRKRLFQVSGDEQLATAEARRIRGNLWGPMEVSS